MQSFFWLWIFSSIMAPQQVPDVEVYQVEKDRYVEVWAKNDHFYPVTVHLDVEVTNMKPDRTLPATSVIRAHTQKLLTRMYPANPRYAWEYTTKFASYMGDIYAEPEVDFAYRLPYDLGASFKVTQGYNGNFSHIDELQYSLDFNLPEATPVHAARGGVVVQLKEDSNEGGPSRLYVNQANFVTILHNDGTFADYSHLQEKSIQVKIGQEVRTGQFVGLSGATGYVTGPHLHFDVKVVTKGGKYVSVPVKFDTKKGVVELQEGETYTAW